MIPSKLHTESLSALQPPALNLSILLLSFSFEQSVCRSAPDFFERPSFISLLRSLISCLSHSTSCSHSVRVLSAYLRGLVIRVLRTLMLSRSDTSPLSLPLQKILFCNDLSRVLHPRSFGQAFDLLVTVSSIHYCTSTSALSTSSSSRGLMGFLPGYLILRGASRLDAFSVYPGQTWLLCYAVGTTTDTPAVRPTRSSRTKASPSQISFARAG